MLVAKAVLTALDIVSIWVEFLSGVRVSVELFQLQSFPLSFNPTFLYPLPSLEIFIPSLVYPSLRTTVRVDQIGIREIVKPHEVVYISTRCTVVDLTGLSDSVRYTVPD